MLTGIVLFVLFLAAFVFYVMVNWKLLTKCGERGWKCLIPIYGPYVRTCCATYNQGIRRGVLISNILLFVSSIAMNIFGANVVEGIAKMFVSAFITGGVSNRMIDSTVDMGVLTDVMFAVSLVTFVLATVFELISAYCLGLSFDEDRSLGVLMACPATSFIASAIVVFDSEIEYGGPVGEEPVDEYDDEYDDDDYDDDYDDED